MNLDKSICPIMRCEIKLITNSEDLDQNALQDGWMTCDLISFPIVFQSYHNGRLIREGSM